MKRLRTTLIIHLTTLIWFVGGYGIGGESKNLQRIYRVSDVVLSDENESETLITYQPINQPADIANGIIFDVTLTTSLVDYGSDSTSLLISTTSKDSCESENETLPAWKINNERRKFRLKINLKTTQEFAGSTIFLCIFNDYLGQMQHLGVESSLKIDKNNLNIYNDDDR